MSLRALTIIKCLFSLLLFGFECEQILSHDIHTHNTTFKQICIITKTNIVFFNN